MDDEPTIKQQESKTISALLLAAGRSERMGAFKPLLPFGKGSVIQSCLNYLRTGGVEDIVVVAGYRAGDLRTQLHSNDVRIALNEEPTSEMGTSIVRGVELLSPNTKCVLIALVDHPAVQPEVIATIITQWRNGSRLVIPTWNGRGGHPVLIDANYRSELLALDQERGLKSFFAAHINEVVRLPVNSPYVARDMDTWDDYCELHQTVFGYPPELD